MKNSVYLFSESGLSDLRSFLQTPTLLAFDYDGTLSKIVVDPDKAKLTQKISDSLKKISVKLPVAIVSGRSVENLKQRLPSGNFCLIGNHGLEGISGIQNSLKFAEQLTNSWIKAIQTEFGNRTDIQIENKQYSLTLHYRLAENGEMAEKEILDFVQELAPKPRVIRGKKVVNLVSETAPNKGTAVKEILKNLQLNQSFYIGDDDTDEDVFDLQDTRLFTVRVGNEKKTNAKYFIREQSEIERLLQLLETLLVKLIKS